MYSRLECVALRTVKYDDRRSIITAWSRQLGPVSLLMPDGASREAKRRRALIMPLSLFEGQADIRPSKQLLSIRDLRPLILLPDIHANPAKTLTAMFLAEVLEKSLRQAPADTVLTDFLFSAIKTLDHITSPTAIANFSLLFMIKFAEHQGIAPDFGGWTPKSILDMQESVLRGSAPLHRHWLTSAQTRLARTLTIIPLYRSGLLKLSKATRRDALDTILNYFTLHHINLSNLQTLPILREL